MKTSLFFSAVCSSFLLSHSLVGLGSDRGQQLYKTCVPCHGPQAKGRQAMIQAPAIAGLDEWYLKRQLGKFRAGVRGKQPGYGPAQRMHKLSLTLNGQSDVDDVASYVSSMPRSKLETTFMADAVAGETKYKQVCVVCHGQDGRGVKAQNAPSLVGTSDWYILTQLHNFKKGLRGGDPTKDPTGAIMAGIASTLSEEDMKNVTYFIQKGFSVEQKKPAAD